MFVVTALNVNGQTFSDGSKKKLIVSGYPEYELQQLKVEIKNCFWYSEQNMPDLGPKLKRLIF